MSSKSRKQTPKPGHRPKTSSTLEPGDAGHEAPHESAFELPDELIHVPKETSKLRFVLMVLLVIVLLVIFVAPSAFIGATSGRQTEAGTFASWTLPSGKQVELDQIKFIDAKRSYDSCFAVHPLLRSRLGISDRSPSDADTARLLILDQMAKDSGIAISDLELGQELRDAFDLYASLQQFGGPANVAEYQALANRYGGTKKVEDSMRGCLRAERFLNMIASVAAQGDPARVEELWNEQHKEQAFEYVAVAAADFEDAARAELLDDTALQAWFEALPEDQKRSFQIPEKRSLTFVTFEDTATTPATGLLAAYPEPADAIAEERAQAYYDRSFFLRFRRPEPAEDAEIDPTNPPTPYLSFDEVSETCLAEAPVFFALQAWNEELKTKTLAGETIDLAAEATRLGLKLHQVPPTSRTELTELETVGGIATAAIAFQTTPGSFFANVNVLEDSLAVARVDAKVEATLPEFADLRDEAAERWVTQRSNQLVEERLKALRIGFESFTPEVIEGQPPRTDDPRRTDLGNFRVAAEALGMTVQRRDWVDRGVRTLAELPDSESDVANFFWRNRQFQSMELGEVSSTVADATTGMTYLVTLAEERPVPVSRMKPAEYNEFLRRSSGEVRGALITGFDEDYLKSEFGLHFKEPEPADGDSEDA